MAATRRVRIIEVMIEEGDDGLALATSADLPTLHLVATRARMLDLLPEAILKAYRLAQVPVHEVLPIDTDKPTQAFEGRQANVEWAAIIAGSQQTSLGRQ
jgi:hypothetical protein